MGNTLEVVGGSPMGMGDKRVGIDHDAEIVISSKGSYIFSCFCGATSFGNLETSIRTGSIDCLHNCGTRISAKGVDFTGGPRAYTIHRKKSD